MELFILAAVSLTIAVSLLLKKEKDAVQVSFALVCLALFLQKGGRLRTASSSIPSGGSRATSGSCSCRRF